MVVQSVVLSNFRNYQKEEISFSPQINLVIGDNGEGKTNLLESLFVLATTKSYRQAHEREMVLIGQDTFYLQGKVTLAGGQDYTLELGYSQKQNKKSAKISGVPIVRLSEFIGFFKVVCFSPDDLEIIKGSPGIRRRFLDILLSQLDRSYLNDLQQYTKVLRQRNECLRAISKGKMQQEDLFPWNEQMATLALKITERRLRAVVDLAPLFKSSTQQINQGRENLGLSYQGTLTQDGRVYSKNEALECWQRRQKEEVARGITLIGPHRDDLYFSINGVAAADYASQGQQRTGVLGLKLAELEYMNLVTGNYPTLLLDDVFSELDQVRRELLISILSGKIQSVITGTETPYLTKSFGALGAKVIKVQQGKLKQSYYV